jgi:hypothetical protein
MLRLTATIAEMKRFPNPNQVRQQALVKNKNNKKFNKNLLNQQNQSISQK